MPRSILAAITLMVMLAACGDATGPSSTTDPSFAPDVVLAGKFPTAIAGNPVTTVQTVPLLAYLNTVGSPDDVQQFRQALGAAGFDLDTVSFGSTTVTIDGIVIGIQAIRTPNGSASAIVTNYASIRAILDPEAQPAALSTSTIGGKTVTSATNPDDGSVNYLYVTGDTVFFVSDPGADAAATILAALP